MAEQSHGDLSGDEVACKLARFSATGGNEGNRRPLGSRAAFLRFGLAECHQSSRHKFSVKSRESGLQTHSHSSTDRLRFRSALARPLDRLDRRAFLEARVPSMPCRASLPRALTEQYGRSACRYGKPCGHAIGTSRPPSCSSAPHCFFRSWHNPPTNCNGQR
jgi:hypothetical protein